MPLQTIVFLSFLDLILGGVFIAIGLIVLLDWQITDIVAWLPFVVVGGLLVFTTFLRSAARPQPCTRRRCAAGALTRALVCSVCGACAAKCCTCCIKVSVPLVLLICLLECGASAPACAARLAGVPLPCPRPASTNERSR